MKTFGTKAPHPERALQAWQILIASAMNRQTLTYESLSSLMYGKKAAGVLAQILGHVAYYCIENRLPPLTTIVVGKHPGKPGTGIPINHLGIDRQREKVYAHNWYDTYPPSAKDFEASYKKLHKKTDTP